MASSMKIELFDKTGKKKTDYTTKKGLFELAGKVEIPKEIEEQATVAAAEESPTAKAPVPEPAAEPVPVAGKMEAPPVVEGGNQEFTVKTDAGDVRIKFDMNPDGSVRGIRRLTELQIPPQDHEAVRNTLLRDSWIKYAKFRPDSLLKGAAEREVMNLYQTDKLFAAVQKSGKLTSEQSKYFSDTIARMASGIVRRYGEILRPESRT